MANPFGIEQVNIPSLLGLHQQMKDRRLEELYRAQQMEAQQQKIEREDRKEQALAKIFMSGPKGGDPSSGSDGATPAPPPPSETASAPQTVTPQQAGPILHRAAISKTITNAEAGMVRQSLGPSGGAAFGKWMADNGISIADTAPPHPLDTHTVGHDLPPRTDGLTINQDALREYFAIDPQAASQIQRFVYDSDANALKQATARGEAMAVAAQALSKVPADQRSGELQKWAPFLEQRGFHVDQLRGVDLSDASLNRFFTQGNTLAQVISKDEKSASDAESRRRWEVEEARRARAEGRAAVRFQERDKDRAALAASGGGIRTNVDDLNY